MRLSSIALLAAAALAAADNTNITANTNTTANTNSTILLPIPLPISMSLLPSVLKASSSRNWPTLKSIGQQIWENPELGRSEKHAHDLIVNHFSKVKGWQVTPSLAGLPTAFKLVFENWPLGFPLPLPGPLGQLPTVGFLAEYDALPAIGHACGHHLIALNAIEAATLASEALIELGIPGRIVVVGTPDEEMAAGKFVLNNAGVFDISKVWMMVHPGNVGSTQPMNARLNYFSKFKANNHSQAVFEAYSAMEIINDLNGKLPGTDSKVINVENVGIFACNTVQTQIGLGVAGASVSTVQKTIDSILDDTWPGVAAVAHQDANGVAINITGPGGQVSADAKSPLILSVETFKALKEEPGISFYLPMNTTVKELDITIDMRTRYTSDLSAVAAAVSKALGTLPDSLTSDVKYPALEVDPNLGQLFIDIVTSKDYGMKGYGFSTFAPASTDASWIQNANVDPVSHKLKSVDVAVLHANYGICEPGSALACVPNHEPAFKILAAQDYAYELTEIMSRAQADLAVKLLADSSKMKTATAMIK